MTVMMTTVLPVCFATPTSYSSSLISFALTKRTTATATLLQNLFIQDNKFLTNRHNGTVLHRHRASSSFEQRASGLESVSTSSSSSISTVSNLRTSLEDVVSNIQTSINTTYTSVESTIEQSIDGFKQSLDSSVSTLFNYIDISKGQLGSKLVVSSDVFKNNLDKAGSIGIDILRQIIVKAEDVLYHGATFVVYSYESTKVLLPVEVRNVLNGSEAKLSSVVLKPVGSSLQQVFAVLEQIERSVGLNPNDPIVSFAIFLGASATLGISYWVVQYGGYSGDLSPKATLEILKNEERVVLVDVRPEELREKEGIPDLRQGARFKYVSITFPKLDNSSKKLLKNTKDVEEATLAILIRNLKIVQEGSKIIIMDAHGEQSKGIARFLRKFGMKGSYLVKGGFKSWVKTGSKFKQLKSETALTILNEEAEAILDDIKPTPALVISYGLVTAIAIYSLLEWEKTLQLIGIVGLGKTLYQRISLYEDSDDFERDLRLLLTPLDLGAQALAWTAEKLEPSKIALPTTPSSTEVQDRVMQAVAKHESQPSDQDDDKDVQTQPVDLKEA